MKSSKTKTGYFWVCFDILDINFATTCRNSKCIIHLKYTDKNLYRNGKVERFLLIYPVMIYFSFHFKGTNWDEITGLVRSPVLYTVGPITNILEHDFLCFRANIFNLLQSLFTGLVWQKPYFTKKHYINTRYLSRFFD